MACVHDEDPPSGRQFIDLAGGVEVPIVAIPTAGGATEYSQQTPVSQLLRQLMFEPCPTPLTVYYEAYAIPMLSLCYR